jgi:hypothetical protein
MYISFDDGARWQPFQLNLPVTPITDLAVHESDLVVSTQGRSFWILDDVTPLRQLTSDVVEAPMHLFKPRDTYQMEIGGRSRSSEGGDGENPQGGVLIYYTFDEVPSEDVALDILDAEDQVVRTSSNRPGTDADLPTRAGMNRFVWDLRYPGGNVPPGVILRGGPPEGAKAVPGTYRARLTAGASIRTQSFQVLKDPRISATVADLQAQHDLQARINARIEDTYDAMRQIRGFKVQLRERATHAAREADSTVLEDAAVALEEKLTTVEGELLNLRFRSEKDPLNFEPKLDNLLAYVSNAVAGSDGRPTPAMTEAFQELDQRLQVQLERLKELIDNDIATFNDLARKLAIPIIASGEGP